MLQQLSKVRYEERKHSYDKAGVLDEQYKERIHNIKYYMKQIGIYLEGGQYRKIADILSELQLGIYKEEKDLICSNRFLNALLVDYRGVAKKNHVQVDIFVEAGFRKKEYEGIVCRISCPSREEKIALAKEIVKIKQQEI